MARGQQVLLHPGIISTKKRGFQTIVVDRETKELKPVVIPANSFIYLDPNSLDSVPLLAMVEFCREKKEEFYMWCMTRGFQYRE